nr:transposase [Mycobacterium riyadhense]
MYGDSAYADGATLDEQTTRGHDMRAKVPPVRNANGYSKDRFSIDLAAGTVTCPAQHTVVIREGRRQRLARFDALCGSCPLRSACTKAHRGRVTSIHPHEAALQHAKARQKTRTGARITGPIGPSSNEKSATSPAGPGLGATPAAVAQNGS